MKRREFFGAAGVAAVAPGVDPAVAVQATSPIESLIVMIDGTVLEALHGTDIEVSVDPDDEKRLAIVAAAYP